MSREKFKELMSKSEFPAAKDEILLDTLFDIFDIL